MDILPIVLVAVFIESFEQLKGKVFFQKLSRLNYPKKRMHLFIHDAVRTTNYYTIYDYDCSLTC